MVVVCLAGLIGAYLTSYIRARAEALGVDAKVGMVQRPERIVLLSVPQAFFGLALNGWVLGRHHRIPQRHGVDHRRAAHGRCLRTDHGARRRPADPTHYRKNILAASQTPDRHAPIVLKGE